MHKEFSRVYCIRVALVRRPSTSVFCILGAYTSIRDSNICHDVMQS